MVEMEWKYPQVLADEELRALKLEFWWTTGLGGA